MTQAKKTIEMHSACTKHILLISMTFEHN